MPCLSVSQVFYLLVCLSDCLSVCLCLSVGLFVFWSVFPWFINQSRLIVITVERSLFANLQTDKRKKEREKKEGEKEKEKSRSINLSTIVRVNAITARKCVFRYCSMT